MLVRGVEENVMNHEAAQDTFRICTQWWMSSFSFPDGQECVEIVTEPPRRVSAWGSSGTDIS